MAAAFETEAPSLIRTLGTNTGCGVLELLTEQKISTEVLVLELRLSCQQTATAPVESSTDIRCRNWLRVVLSSLTRARPLQVAPLSSEKRTKMFRSLLSSGSSSA